MSALSSPTSSVKIDDSDVSVMSGVSSITDTAASDSPTSANAFVGIIAINIAITAMILRIFLFIFRASFFSTGYSGVAMVHLNEYPVFLYNIKFILNFNILTFL